MISYQLIGDIDQFIPQGERSDFINKVLEEALINLKNEIAFSEMEKLRLKSNFHMTNDETIESINYGRK